MNNNHIIRAKFEKILEKQSEINDLIKDIERDLNAKIEYAPVFPSHDIKYKSYSHDSSMYSGTASGYDYDSDKDSYGNEYNIGLDIDDENEEEHGSLLDIPMSPNLLKDLGIVESEEMKSNTQSVETQLKQDKWVAPSKPGLDNSLPLL